jgi:benzoate-CoA ligase family protein
MNVPILAIDRSESPSRIAYGSRFNAASWFIDRHLDEGRQSKIAVRQLGSDITYSDLCENVARIGNALLGLGLEPGSRVMMVVKDCVEFFYVFWGAMKAGLIPVPVSFMMRTSDIAFMIADSGCDSIVYSSEFAASVVPALVSAATGAQGLRLEDDGVFLSDMTNASPVLDSAESAPDDVAFWLYSSGTTGRPKGVPHRHCDIVTTCEHYAIGILGLNEEDHCYSAAKLFFAYGLGNAMTFPLYVGGTAVLDERRPTPETTFETISTMKPTAYFGVPTLYAAQLQMLERSGEHLPDVSSLRLCVSAGEALPPDLFRRWKDVTGLEILDGIGSTEALHIFISNIAGQVEPGATGRIVPGYEARILDENGMETKPGEAGQLEIQGDSVTTGYWNRSEQNKVTLVDGWLRTGDQYIRDEDGLFRYQGRADDMIKVGGIWCSPFDIEARLIEHPLVLEAAVVGREDQYGLIKPEAFVVRAETFQETADVSASPNGLEAELVDHCQEGLPKYMYPRWIHFVEDLPKTATGKIQRYRLRQT